MFASIKSKHPTELSTRQRWAYALPALSMALPTLPFYVLLPVFYAEHTSLSLVEVGFWLLMARLIDLGSDLLAARLCDKPLGRFGRRGWIGLGALLLAPGLIGLGNPPADAGALWLLGFSTLLYSGWTLIQIPYTAWLASLESRSEARVGLGSLREMLGVVGLVLSASWPALAGVMGLPSEKVFEYLTLLTLALGSTSLIWMWIQLPSPEQAEVSGLHTSSESDASTNRSQQQWKAIYQLQPQRRLLLVWWLNGFANAVAAVLFPLIISDWLNLSEDYRGYFLLAYFSCALIAFPVWRKLAQRFPQSQVWQLAMLMAVIGFIAMPLLPPDPFLYLLVVIITGASLGADLALPHSLQSDLVRWEMRVFNRYQPALHFAGASVVIKLGLGLGVALAPALLTLFGWNEQLSHQSHNALTALVMIYCWLPCLLKGAAAMLIRDFEDSLQDPKPDSGISALITRGINKPC